MARDFSDTGWCVRMSAGGMLVFLFVAGCGGGDQTASDGPFGGAPSAPTGDFADATPARLDDALRMPALVNVAARPHQDLSGQWAYLIDTTDVGWRSFTRNRTKGNVVKDVRDSEIGPTDLKEYDFDLAPRTAVPGSWTAQVPELTWYDGTVWYRTLFTATPEAGKRQVLQFEAVNYHAGIFLNGSPVGEHWGGFTPFAFDMTELLKPEENSLVVGVNGKHSDVSVPTENYDWQNFPGITRAVRLVAVPETRIDDVWARLEGETAIRTDVVLQGPARAGQNVMVSIPELGLSETVATDANGRASAAFPAPAGLVRWSPESPKLYSVQVRTTDDRFEDRIGFRTIRVEGEEILLNGQPIFLRGISMHEEALGAVAERIATTAQARPLLEEIKDGLNGNFVRLSHYPHAESTVRLAEEVGLLVWSEIPVYWGIAFANPTVRELALAMLEENIRRDRNRAAVIIWSVGNETPISEPRNGFMRALVDRTRQLDPTRLVSMAMHTVKIEGDVVLIDDPLVDAVDLLSVNFYEGWYGGARLSRLADLTFDREATKPMIFSEFGAGATFGFSDPQTRRKFSEEFQADYYAATLEMAGRVPFMRGVSPWILKDFRSPRRLHSTYQDYWNRKGVISPEGERKQAFQILADWYAEIAAAGYEGGAVQ